MADAEGPSPVRGCRKGNDMSRTLKCLSLAALILTATAVDLAAPLDLDGDDGTPAVAAQQVEIGRAHV